MKLIIIVLMIILFSLAARADITLDEGIKMNPSQSNVTYIINQTQTALTVAQVNETCVTINTTSYCNSSTATQFIQLFEILDTTIPYVNNVTNTTTTNDTIIWDADLSEAVNITGTYGNGTSHTNAGNFSNSTLTDLFTFTFTNLFNGTMYKFNITSICDASGNCNTTGFNFSFLTSRRVGIILPRFNLTIIDYSMEWIRLNWT